MTKLIAAVAAVLLLGGCVSTKSVKADLGSLKGEAHSRVTVVAREVPAFGAMTAGKAGFGLLGVPAMIAAGNALVRDNGVEDPAPYIAAALAKSLGAALSLPVDAQAGPLKASDPVAVAKQFPGASLLLDVETTNWGYVYFPTDWTHYRVNYSAKLRLFDVDKKKLVAEGFCPYASETSTPPTHDQLLADKAALLKANLRKAADQCVEAFGRDVLAAGAVAAI